MIFTTTDYFSVDKARLHRRAIFVFGDNLGRVGRGGQAIIRGEPNTIGIATKRSCGEFMTGTLEDVTAVVMDLRRVEGLLLGERRLIFPILENGDTSLGCGLAELPIRAPALYGLINDWFDRLPDKRRVDL